MRLISLKNDLFVAPDAIEAMFIEGDCVVVKMKTGDRYEIRHGTLGVHEALVRLYRLVNDALDS